ncbi:hypothetical protein ACN9NO_11415, partial [Glaesserella parasuis]|uniref:hypothetical protein n=1 Tax=Glaesserella parasuis TaxID=738 RepID=UPI003B20FC97
FRITKNGRNTGIFKKIQDYEEGNNIRNNIKNFINQLTAFLYKKAFWRQVLIIVLISTLIFPLGACGLNSKARRYIVYYRNMASTKLIETNYDTKT